MSRIWLVVGGLSVAAVAQFVIPDLPRDLVDSSFFGGSMTYAPWLLAIIVIGGIGEAFAFPAEQAIFVSIGRKVGMGSMMGLNQMGGGIGFLGGSLVGAAVVAGIGIDAVFRAAGIITLVGAVLFAVMMSRAIAREAEAERVAGPASIGPAAAAHGGSAVAVRDRGDDERSA